MKKSVCILASFSLILSLFIGFFSPVQAADKSAIPKMELRMGSPFPGPPAGISAGVAYWQELITKRSGGNITFKNFWSGTLFTMGESVEAVQNRVVDIAWTSAGSATGKLNLRNFQSSCPWAPGDPYTAMKIWHKLIDKFPAIADEMAKYKIKEIYGQGGLPYDIQSREPIVTLDDLQGKKVGVFGKDAPKWIGDAGGVPVNMAMTNRYVGLQRGTIDAHLTAYDWVVDAKFYEVAKHYTKVELAAMVMPWGGLWVNLDLWNSFTPELQQLFLDAGKDAEQNFIDQTVMARRARDIEIMKENGMIIHTMSDAEKAKWANKMNDYAAEWAKDAETKGLPGWQLIDTYIKFGEEEGHKWPRRWGRR